MRRRAVAVILVVAFGLGASGTSRAEEPEKSLRISGSDTMLVLNRAWGEAFEEKAGDVRVLVDGGGSSVGIDALLAGWVDIAATSRAMSDEERGRFLERFDVPVRELVVAVDGLAIYVHQGNPVSHISMSEAARLFSGQIRNWQELGGRDRRVRLYIRNADSGTRAFFRELVLGELDYAAFASALATTPSILEAVSRDQSGVGHGGIGYARAAKILMIRADADGPPVFPNEADVATGAYPLSRPLRFYFKERGASRAVEAFVDFVLSSDGQAIVRKVGYYGVTSVSTLPLGAEAEAGVEAGSRTD